MTDSTLRTGFRGLYDLRTLLGQNTVVIAKLQPVPGKVTVVHYADPWCWFCWGLEPVIQRLKEVYGDEIDVVYRTGGIFDDFDSWISDEGLSSVDDLRTWVRQSHMEMQNPFKLTFISDMKPSSTYPACIATKAAEEQGNDLGYRFYRSLLEETQLLGKNGSDKLVQINVAGKVGLNVIRFESDLSDPIIKRRFQRDKATKKKEGMSMRTLEIISPNGDKKIRVTGYDPLPYEKAIDEVAGGKIWKRTPIDILEYFERRKDQRVSAKEISTVFQIEESEALRRLGGLSDEGLLKKVTIQGVGDFWSANSSSRFASLSLEQVQLAHVTPGGKPPKTVELEEILKPTIRKLYTDVSLRPDKDYHFPVGMKGAILAGYPKNELSALPPSAVESFAGVGYPFAAKVIRKQDAILDVGSGSGTDVLVSSLKTGTEGQVIGLDFTDAMIRKAEANISKARVRNAKIVKGEATKIPLPSGSVSVVTTNGVLNLVPNKGKALEEIFRVLRPGGHVQISDILVRRDVSSVCGVIPQLWADCIGGAAVQSEFEDMMMKTAGFSAVETVRSFDYFAASPSEQMRRLAKTFGAKSVTIKAVKM